MNKKAFIITGVVFTLFILFGVFHNSANQRHSVSFFAGSQFIGYENSPPVAKIDASPSIAWHHASPILKILGFIFLIGMWWGIWWVGTDRYLGKSKVTDPGERSGLAYAVTLGPIILSFVLFFAAYSSGQTNNSYAVERTRFDSWLNSGAIEKRGERTYVDGKRSDTLKNLFNKPWIR